MEARAGIGAWPWRAGPQESWRWVNPPHLVLILGGQAPRMGPSARSTMLFLVSIELGTTNGDYGAETGIHGGVPARVRGLSNCSEGNFCLARRVEKKVVQAASVN